MPQEIVQITTGQVRIGEIERPSIFALTENGDIFEYVPAMKGGQEPEWKRIPPIPDFDDEPVS